MLRCKAGVQEADVHMSNAALRNTLNSDSLLVEMPADFDVAGDAGAIGHLALHTKGSTNIMHMDIKGIVHLHADCSAPDTQVPAANS